MLGAILGGAITSDDDLLLTSNEFGREISRERVRATRRQIPFCILTIEIVGRKQLRQRAKTLVRLLHRNLRMTDRKGQLSRVKFGVLLVDTPEMGGRSVLQRLTALAEDSNLNVNIELKVHDPEGFDPDDFPSDSNRRFGDTDSKQWLRVDESNVEVTSETPMVSRPMFRMLMKRGVDIAGASFGLVIGSPILLTSMALVRFTSSGPALFRQTREGLGGRPFTIYKLRTMVVDAESRQADLKDASHRDGPAFKIKKDPRVTKIGKLFRATCIDELPQLWNVLKGDMSLVGPRPLPWHESRACSAWHRRRLDVRPGMTCLWQVNKSAAETFDDWMRMDLRYVDRINFLSDLKLIIKTFVVPLTGRGSE